MKSQPVAASVALTDCHGILFPKLKSAQAIAAIVERTRLWTSEDPLFTQLIYQYVQQYSAQILRAEGANIVDEIVRHKIVKNWRDNDASIQLNCIEQALHSFEPQDTLLVLYLQILWRDGVDADTQSKLEAEKEYLLRLGLIKQEKNCLEVANRIYAAVFDMDWIEQQRPGLTTRSVLIPELADPTVSESVSLPVQASSIQGYTPEETSHAANTTRATDAMSTSVATAASPSKFAYWLTIGLLAAGGSVLFGFATVTYFRMPSNSGAMAEPFLEESMDSQATATQFSASQDPKVLFDQGMEHATNGRWLHMARQFCSISPDSAYFAPAKKQLEHWVELYPQDIQRANDTLLTERNVSCLLIENALKAAM